MDNQIRDLLAQIYHSDDNDGEILQLALIIERSNHEQKNKAEYTSNLSEEQLKIILSIDDQKEISKNLLEHVNSIQKGGSILWIIGKSAPVVLVKILPKFLLKEHQTLDDEKLLQSLFAITNCFVFEEDPDYSSIISALEIDKLLSLMKRLTKHTNERISYQAGNVLETLDFLS